MLKNFKREKRKPKKTKNYTILDLSPEEAVYIDKVSDEEFWERYGK